MNRDIARLVLLVVLGSTLFGIAGTLGRYLFNDLRASVWFGPKAQLENIRVVRVDGRDIIFSNGDRINGDLMMPYNIIAALIMFVTLCLAVYCEIYFITYVLKYDIMKAAGYDTIPPLRTNQRQGWASLYSTGDHHSETRESSHWPPNDHGSENGGDRNQTNEILPVEKNDK